jgi:hypothetical protein
MIYKFLENSIIFIFDDIYFIGLYNCLKKHHISYINNPVNSSLFFSSIKLRKSYEV